MAETHVDPARAAAESALERLGSDDGSLDGRTEPGEELDLRDTVGLHIEPEQAPGPEADAEAEDELARELAGEVHLDPDPSVCMDALAEAFNARDLEELLSLVTDDCETPGLANDLDDFALAMEDLWHRRPTCLLTRGEHEEQVVGVLWELAEARRWWRLATVHLDDVVDGRAGVVEFTDDAALLEEVATEEPDLDLEEGSRWAEWADGDGP